MGVNGAIAHHVRRQVRFKGARGTKGHDLGLIRVRSDTTCTSDDRSPTTLGAKASTNRGLLSSNQVVFHYFDVHVIVEVDDILFLSLLSIDDYLDIDVLYLLLISV